jgi:hydroxymethylbilane synthase
MTKQRIVVGTRGSALAQWQTNYVLAALKRVAPDLEIETHIIKTTGDKDQTRSLADLGGLGVFTKEIEHALLAREIDLAVHSLKDLPTETAAGLTIGAIPEREDPRDCIVSRHKVGLQSLPRGARIGTSSARRTAQLLALRPDVHIVPLRGNVDTRLRKAQSEEYDAVVLAAAGIIRLGRGSEITEYLPLSTFLPDPGQGALAIEIRASDVELDLLVALLDHAPTRSAVTAERAFLRSLGGGCRMPIGAYAEWRGAQLHLDALIASDDGAQIHRGEIAGEPSRAEELGTAMALRLRGAATSTRSPLQGRRILVTRAQSQAAALADRLRALGAEPIEFPTIDFAPLEDFRELDRALYQAADFNWVIFTSANGARYVAERSSALGVGARGLAAAKLAAIGPATAGALEQIGLKVDFVPTKYLGEQIALELPIQPGQRALLLRADIASDVLAHELTARGVVVANVEAYRTVLPAAQTVDLRNVEAVTFTSSSTVRNFVALLDGAGGGLARAAVFCIGPVTAETARELGLHVDAVASEHTIDGLVTAMLEYYRTKGTTDHA